MAWHADRLLWSSVHPPVFEHEDSLAARKHNLDAEEVLDTGQTSVASSNQFLPTEDSMQTALSASTESLACATGFSTTNSETSGPFYREEHVTNSTRWMGYNGSGTEQDIFAGLDWPYSSHEGTANCSSRAPTIEDSAVQRSLLNALQDSDTIAFSKNSSAGDSASFGLVPACHYPQSNLGPHGEFEQLRLPILDCIQTGKLPCVDTTLVSSSLRSGRQDETLQISPFVDWPPRPSVRVARSPLQAPPGLRPSQTMTAMRSLPWTSQTPDLGTVERRLDSGREDCHSLLYDAVVMLFFIISTGCRRQAELWREQEKESLTVQYSPTIGCETLARGNEKDNLAIDWSFQQSMDPTEDHGQTSLRFSDALRFSERPEREGQLVNGMTRPRQTRNAGVLVSCIKQEWLQVFEDPSLADYMHVLGFKKLKALLLRVPNILIHGSSGLMRVTTKFHIESYGISSDPPILMAPTIPTVFSRQLIFFRTGL
eukprot:GHVN01022239.1.p1 GENE.GHVN01022239.1~~GHVN01022239.1.p1  ORF type:complete len:484 (-),score=18.15 GHVN01022239.1:139-1590(-)